MWCNIYRFMISHAADRGCRPSSLTLRHIERCDSCGRFYEHCLLMAVNLKCDIDDRTPEQPGEYVQRVIAAIPERTTLQERRVRFRPLAAACIGLPLIAAAVFFAVRPDKTVKHFSQKTAVQQIPAGEILAVLNQPLADPLSGELKQIADEAESAARFIVACVNVDIGGETTAEN